MAKLTSTPENTREEWDRYRTSLRRVWSCTRHGSAKWKTRAGDNRHQCSTHAVTGGVVIGACIGLMHGVIRLIRAATLEYVKKGVLVHVVNPVRIDTQIGSDVMNVDEVAHAGTRKFIPLGRVASRKGVDSVMLFLCGPSKSFVFGQRVTVDGTTVP